MLKSIGAFFSSLLGGRTPEEDYQAGRSYCESTLDNAMPDQDVLDTLWAQSKTDRTFGGNGQFDRGIEDVLREYGYEDPET